MKQNDIKQIYEKNALSLAFLGDSVFSLYVRQYLVKTHNLKPNELNKRANSVVSAKAQALVMEKLTNLTEDEQDIITRARNSHLNSIAKHATLPEYSKATQLEALVGYWHLTKQTDKIEKLFKDYVLENL